MPGVAKTLLVRTLAHVLGCDFARIQFTPDLMPADITGTNVFNLQRNEFSLIKGPVFTSFLLADEINRAPAKTQSALLQAMQERLVTIDRETHALPPNFTVFATQNPIEYEGTYPLPEAQKDRFMLKITMKTPERAEELALAQRTMTKEAPEDVLASGAVKAGHQGRRPSGRCESLVAVAHPRRTHRLPGGYRPRHPPARERPGRRRPARHPIADPGRPRLRGYLRPRLRHPG